MIGLGIILPNEGLATYLVGKLLYYAGLLLAAGIGLSIIGLNKRAMRRFRELWIEEHDSPMNP
jgi:hypothetical protein